MLVKFRGQVLSLATKELGKENSQALQWSQESKVGVEPYRAHVLGANLCHPFLMQKNTKHN